MGADYELAGGQVHIWYLALTAFQEPSRLPAYLELLSSEERHRYSQFAFDSLRLNYLVSHALTRIILARYEGTAPAELSFTRNAFGRPELNDSPFGLRFNLSHARSFAALAVTRTWDIGIDLECDDHPVSPLEIADRYFAPEEVAWLRARPAARLKSDFISLWSLKEAYAKAYGHGLSLALDQFCVEIPDRAPPRLARPAGTESAAGDWRLYMIRPTPACALSAAVRCGALAEPRLAMYEFTPAGTRRLRSQPPPVGRV